MKTTLWQQLSANISECLTGKRAAQFVQAKEQQKTILAVYSQLDFVQQALEKPVDQRDQAKENAPQLLSNLSQACRHFDTAERMKAKPYRMETPTFNRDILAPELARDVAEMTDKIIAEHSDDLVDWYDYEDVCKLSPEATDLWRKHSDKFGYEDDYSIRNIVELMPEEFRNKAVFSNDGTMYSGAFLPSVATIPLAIYDADNKDDPVFIIIGAYENNSDMVLQDVDDNRPEQRHDVSGFIDEARMAFLPLFKKDATTNAAANPTVK